MQLFSEQLSEKKRKESRHRHIAGEGFLSYFLASCTSLAAKPHDRRANAIGYTPVIMVGGSDWMSAPLLERASTTGNTASIMAAMYREIPFLPCCFWICVVILFSENLKWMVLFRMDLTLWEVLVQLLNFFTKKVHLLNMGAYPLMTKYIAWSMSLIKKS